MRLDARWLLVPLLVLVAVAATAIPFISVWGLDNRTSMEMVDGVKRHGVPYTTNGGIDFDLYPEARVPFNLPVHGKLWGTYAPLYPYVAAPAALVDGVRGLHRLNAILIGLAGLCAFLLGRRVHDNPYVGVGAAYVVVLSSPAFVCSFETLASPLLLVMITLATYFGVRTIDEDAPRTFRWAALTGVFAAGSMATHLVAAPMALMLLYAIGLVDPNATAATTFLARVRAIVPRGLGARRFGVAMIAFVIALSPVAILNHARFSTFNPISYGPCPWLHCELNAKDSLNTGSLLSFAAPAILWFAGVVLGCIFAWGSPKRLAIVGAFAVFVLLPHSAMRETTLRVLQTMFGFAADVSNITFAGFLRPDDGLGNLNTDRSVKALLECTPILMAAVLTPFRLRGPGARNLVVIMPVVGLFMGLGILGRFDGAYAFGWPYLFLRYTMPAVPLLAVLAMSGIASLPWRPWLVALAIIGGLVGASLFAQRLDDLPYPRRFIELRLTLIAGAMLVVLVVMSRHVARVWLERAALGAAVVAIALGIAISMGVDTRIAVQQTANIDKRVHRFAELTPARLALVGSALDTDQLLSLKMDRDIAYIDFTESRGWEHFRELIDRWSDEGRPIYGAFPRNVNFRWPYADWDVPAEQLDAKEELWRIGPSKARAPKRPL